MNIDLTNDIYYPPLPGVGRLSESALQRLLLDAKKEAGSGEQITAPEAEFRVWSKDEQGRSVVGPWIRPGGPISGKQVES